MTEVVLSDIDGTLVDSNALHAEAWRRTFEHFGIQIRMSDAWSQIGKGGDKLIPVFVPEKDRERLEKPLTQFRKDIWHREYFKRVVSFPKSRELLLKMTQRGLRISLASSSDQEDLKIYKQIVNMNDLIEEESSSGDAKESKPEPDIFSAALKKLGARPDQAIALGDTPYDAEAAGKLGIPVVGVTCGGWKKDDLRDAGCVEVYQDPADLLLQFDRSVFAK